MCVLQLASGSAFASQKAQDSAAGELLHGLQFECLSFNIPALLDTAIVAQRQRVENDNNSSLGRIYAVL